MKIQMPSARPPGLAACLKGASESSKRPSWGSSPRRRTKDKPTAEPQILLSQVSVERDRVRERWNIVWRIENLSAHPIEVLAVRLPHGQFKSAERRFEPTITLAAKQEAQFQVSVQCDEPAGLVTQNAFLIFQIVWLGEPWRIFARVRVIVNSKGEPEVTTELITTQQIGFSGVTS